MPWRAAAVGGEVVDHGSGVVKAGHQGWPPKGVRWRSVTVSSCLRGLSTSTSTVRMGHSNARARRAYARVDEDVDDVDGHVRWPGGLLAVVVIGWVVGGGRWWGGGAPAAGGDLAGVARGGQLAELLVDPGAAHACQADQFVGVDAGGAGQLQGGEHGGERSFGVGVWWDRRWRDGGGGVGTGTGRGIGAGVGSGPP